MARQYHSKTSASDVLESLKVVFPSSISSIELIERWGPAAKSRIGELKRAGWDVRSDRSGGVCHYRLQSLRQGPPDVTLAGVTFRLGSSKGWECRTHADAAEGGRYTAEQLQKAEYAAIEAYRRVLEGGASWYREDAACDEDYGAELDDLMDEVLR
jgi:hypothetical protein